MTEPADGEIRAVIEFDPLGGVVVDAGPDSVLGAQPVDLMEGFRVWIDPIDPARVLRVECTEVTEHAWFVDELFGSGAAQAILVGVGGDQGVTLRPTEVASDVARIGLLLWLEEHSPLPLDQGLLDAELAAAFDAVPGELAAEEVKRRATAALPTVLELGARVTSGAGDIHPTAAIMARQIASTLLASVDLSADQAQAMVWLAAAATAAHTASEVTEDLDANLLVLFDSATAATTWTAGVDASGDIHERRFSVDWCVVPRGALDPRDGTIRARWRPGEQEVTVTVAALAGGEPLPLLVRVLRAGIVDPDTVTQLLHNPETETYRAVLVNIDGLTDGDRVDVFSAAASVAPLVGLEQERQAASLRCAARALTAMRLAAATRSTERAATLWKSAADDWLEWLSEFGSQGNDRAQRDRNLVLSGLARCQRQLGSPMATRTASRISDLTVEPSWAVRPAAASLAEYRLLGLV